MPFKNIDVDNLKIILDKTKVDNRYLPKLMKKSDNGYISNKSGVNAFNRRVSNPKDIDNIDDDAYIDLKGAGIEPQLSNKSYVTLLHNQTADIRHKLKDFNINKAGGLYEKDKLTNLLFDITGSEFEDIDKIVRGVKPFGYKLALILVASSIDSAYIRNASRDRQVDDNIIAQSHYGVAKLVSELTDAKDYILNNFDEFWVVASDLPLIKDGEPVVLDNKIVVSRDNNCFHIKDLNDLDRVIDTFSSIDDALTARVKDNKYSSKEDRDKAISKIKNNYIRNYKEVNRLANDYVNKAKEFAKKHNIKLK